MVVVKITIVLPSTLPLAQADNVAVAPDTREPERQQDDQGDYPAPERHGERRNVLYRAPGDNGVAGPEQRCKNQPDVGQAGNS